MLNLNSFLSAHNMGGVNVDQNKEDSLLFTELEKGDGTYGKTSYMEEQSDVYNILKTNI